jgi:DNA-binding transcriptional regulator YhcF (GntR family)
MIEPRYLQITRAIRTEILTGKLRCGDKIKSENSLADDFNMARMTIRKGLDQLVAEGILKREHRRGTFVASVPIAASDTIDELGTPLFLRARGIKLKIETLDSLPHQLRFWQEAARRFEEEHSRVQAEVVSSPWESGTDSRPTFGDVIGACTWTLPHYNKRNLLRKLAVRLNPDDYPTGFRDSLEYGFPFAYSVSAIAVNDSWLEDAGVEGKNPYRDFEDFIELLLQLQSQFPGQSLFACSPTLPLYIACGDGIETEAGQRTVPESVREVFSVILDLAPGTLRIDDYANRDFYAGKLPFISCSPHALAYDTLPREMRVSFKPLPLARGSVWRYVPMILGISAESAFAHDAENLARFLAEPSQQDLLMSTKAGVPALSAKSATESAWDIFPDLNRVLAEGKPLTQNAQDIQIYVDTVFKPISTRILRRECSLDKGIRELSAQTEQYHKKSAIRNNIVTFDNGDMA